MTARVLDLFIYEEGLSATRAFKLAETQIDDQLKEIGFVRYAGYYYKTFRSGKECFRTLDALKAGGLKLSRESSIRWFLKPDRMGARLKGMLKRQAAVGSRPLKSSKTAAPPKKVPVMRFEKNRVLLVATVINDQPVLAVSRHDKNSDTSKLEKFGFTLEPSAYYMPFNRTNCVEVLRRLAFYGYKVATIRQVVDKIANSPIPVSIPEDLISNLTV